MKYRKKPVVIEAMRFDFPEVIKEFCPDAEPCLYHNTIESFVIKTLEGNMRLRKGEWLIKGIKGEFYPCKPDIFEATYEKVV